VCRFHSYGWGKSTEAKGPPNAVYLITTEEEEQKTLKAGRDLARKYLRTCEGEGPH